MRIGIVSDCHGDCRRLREALRVLRQRGAEAVVHCGDIGSTKCVRALGAAGVPAYLVLGNTDRRVAELQRAARDAGVRLEGETAELAVDGERRLAAAHGHDDAVLNELVLEGRFAYLCHGHAPARAAGLPLRYGGHAGGGPGHPRAGHDGHRN